MKRVQIEKIDRNTYILKNMPGYLGKFDQDILESIANTCKESGSIGSMKLLIIDKVLCMFARSEDKS